MDKSQTEDVPATEGPTDGPKEDDTSVRVAIRIRPQNAREKIDLCQVCTTVLPEEPRQVLLGKDKSFTFDHVFDTPTLQDNIYNTCVRGLIEGCFEGYNATVFAYGQTGSGKTYTMGTGFDTSLLGGAVTAEVSDQVGIVPRAVDHLFLGIEERRRQAFENGDPAPDFKVTAQFMELYNEEILDLLDTTRDPESRGRKSHIRIHEDASGGIYVVGVNTKPVSSLNDTMQCLKSGALGRATASTNMNASSSRSHAIFTLHIRQQRVVKDQTALEEDKETDSTQAEFETLTAKFHFVDLAGSERLKRTGATGDRAKEGISINCGLLALGNVISALGDKAKRGSHVPYRDSKLTRLLQDSLGGNSRTLMIACISPTDQDFMETLNTLKYANRARNIKNKVTANQDKASRQLAILRAEVTALQQELQEYKTGKRTVDANGQESINDLVVENGMLQSENDKLRQRIKVLQDTVSSLQTRSAQMLGDAALASLQVEGSEGQASNEEVSNMIRKYIEEIEELKTKLTESESMCDHLRRSGTPRSPRMSLSSASFMSSSMATEGGRLTSPSSVMDLPSFSNPSSTTSSQHSVLHKAKKEMKKLKKLQMSSSHQGQQNHESDKENLSNNNNEVSGGMEESGVFGEDDPAAETQRSTEGVPKNEEDVGDEEDDDEEEEDSGSDSSSTSDSESEDGGESDNVHEDLANLTCEISIKQRLIEELEQTQRRMNSLRTHYEEKVSQLQTRIRETELERDKVLSNIEKMSHSSSDSSKKVKQEFEKKLGNLQDELKKMQTEQRKHAKIQKNNSQYERHLKTLQHEIVEMKKTKVRLMKQVKEEMDKNRQGEARRTREMAQLRKEQLKRDNVIKNLERQTAQKDTVLKRKQEEVEALRKRQVTKPMSAKAAGRVGKYDRPATIPIAPVSSTGPRRRRKSEFSPKIAKQKWDSIEKNISAQVTKKQTIAMLERDMNIWLKQREKCTKELQKHEKREKDALASNVPVEVIQRLRATVEDLSQKVDHAQENINECQSNIMQVEESKEDGEGENNVEITSMVETMTLEEAKYMVRKLCNAAMDKGLSVASKDSEVKELQGLLNQTQLNNVLQQELLRHMMDGQVGVEVEGLMALQDDQGDGEYSSSSSSSSPAESMLESGFTPTAGSAASAPSSSSSSTIPVMQRSYPPPTSSPGNYDSLTRREKARRKTTTPQDLLYAGPEAAENSSFVASSLMRLSSQSSSPTQSLPSPTTHEVEKLVKKFNDIGSNGGGGGGGSSDASGTGEGKQQSSRLSWDGDVAPQPRAEGGGEEAAATTRGKRSSSMSASQKDNEIASGLGGSGQSSTSAEEETDGGGGAGEELADGNLLMPPPRQSTKKSNIPRQSPLPRRREMEPSPVLARKVFQRSTSAGGDTTMSDATPPASPIMMRRSTGSARNTDENVFNRLTSGGGAEANRPQDKGYIAPARGGATSVAAASGLLAKSSPLYCTHTAEGHSRAVLAVYATDTLMLTGSKDRTAKLWDLGRGAELLTFPGHPNNVVKVAFCPRAQLAFTVSQSTVRVWDTRKGPNACIKTLSSSGLTTSGSATFSNSGRPSDVTYREHQINDICLSPDGTTLFCGAGNVVQIWDLRRYSQAGRLSGHQAPVMALALTKDGDNTLVISGSKDHYIKIFEVIEDAAGILTPKHNLDPPHYDGIQSLALKGSMLFSGSRDMCIKKWDLDTKQLKHSINAAHKDWVCALDFLPGTDTLVSGCRGGFLKLWNSDSCTGLGEVRAHSSAINAIATNTSAIFTASNDCVGIWRYRPESTGAEDSTSS